MVNLLIWHLFKIGAETNARALKLRDQLHGPDHDRLAFRASR
jgi:hypothetical protein